MYAIIELAGKQFKVAKDQEIFTPTLEGKKGASVVFDKVLFLDDNGKMQVGEPLIKGLKVTGEILEHGKGDKIVVFKKKRRKGYKVKNGHRQGYTKVRIKKIGK